MQPSDVFTGVIVRASLVARHARDRELSDRLSGPAEEAFFTRVLDHPYLLSLIELRLNGCTSLKGARALVERGMVDVIPFETDVQRFRGGELECLHINWVGNIELDQGVDSIEGSKYANSLYQAVTGYVCIDDGYGICFARPLLDTALQFPDAELLERAVFAGSGMPQFQQRFAPEDYIDEHVRMKHMASSSTEQWCRLSAAVVDLKQELN